MTLFFTNHQEKIEMMMFFGMFFLLAVAAVIAYLLLFSDSFSSFLSELMGSQSHRQRPGPLPPSSRTWAPASPSRSPGPGTPPPQEPVKQEIHHHYAPQYDQSQTIGEMKDSVLIKRDGGTASPACPACGKPVEVGWNVCQFCLAELKKEDRKSE